MEKWFENTLTDSGTGYRAEQANISFFILGRKIKRIKEIGNVNENLYSPLGVESTPCASKPEPEVRDATH